jgi:hypothetical protein
MTNEVEQRCANCLFWKMLEGHWGVCRGAIGNRRGPLTKYVRPVPEHLETTSEFLCKAFAPSFEALRESHEAVKGA